MDKIACYLKLSSLAKLQGSEKQIAWAEKIRQQAIPVFEKHLKEFETKLKNEKFTEDELGDKSGFLQLYFLPMRSYYGNYFRSIKQETDYQKMEKWVIDNYEEMLNELKKIEDSGWWIDYMRSVDHKNLVTTIFEKFLDSKREKRKFGY